MGIARSLTSGGSALRTHQQRLDVISNNIANVNTTGFKSSRANFADQLSQTMNFGRSPSIVAGGGTGGINPLQFGLGVKMAAITKNMSQGALESTNRPLDLALQGEGFFVYNLLGNQVYSRAGAVSRDRDGYLIDTGTGAYLQGYDVEVDPATGKVAKDANGANVLNSTVENLQIESGVISEPRQTENITVKGNLNANAQQGDEQKTSITVIDNQGGARTLSLTFTKTQNPNEFTVAATIDGNNVALSNSTLTFNADGTLQTPQNLTIAAADLNTALDPSGNSKVFDETSPKDLNISMVEQGNIGGSLTQFSGPNTVTFGEQDGYQSGELLGLSVDKEGKIWGSFTNGQSEVLGQAVMAKVDNPEGMESIGDNFFRTSPNSGSAEIGTAGTIFPSTSIIGESLESSNVDITTEFVDMIATQRAFESASRTVSVTDQMLATINLLKR